MADEKLRNKPYDRHEIVVLNRQAIEVSGVMNVESFDSHEFVLQTSYGYLAIRGENLHIKTLSLETGVVAIEGLVLDLGYFDDGMSTSAKAKSFFGKLFR
jgi:sporulation protein YabP